jgi:hypothetical protein
MQAIALIIVLQVAVTLLAGCSEFETIMEEKRMLTCSPSYETLCAGWEI